MEKMTGKVAVVTGGTSGIGEGAAVLLARNGADVVIVGRNTERGKAVMDKIRLEGGKVKYFPADVSNEKDIADLKNFVEISYGRIDMLFNNAGVLITGALDELTDEEWNRSYDVNVKSVMRMCRSFIPLMLDTGGGYNPKQCVN